MIRRKAAYRGALPLVLLQLLLAGPRAAEGQLISPGKLSAPHAELEGVTRCTSCHELRSPGISPARCLDCHESLARRVSDGRGLHAGDDYRACANCHQDHHGREFDLVRWEPGRLDHAETGFDLEGVHGTLECRSCHRASLVRDADVRLTRSGDGALDRTFLGLGRGCADCHGSDDPHAGAFEPSPCSECHDQVDWAAASKSFDHDRTRYPLSGRHRVVSCVGCHATGAYDAVRFAACSDCHVDPHAGAMTAACTSCHTTGGWDRVTREAVEAGFDHARVFPLEEAHADADCQACHGPSDAVAAHVRISFRPGTETRTWPAPRTDAGCLSCHIDVHAGELDTPAGPAVCDDCHSQSTWYPSTFDVSRHELETRFRLTGAHRATPCGSCHDGAPGAGQFRSRSLECVSCHQAEQPHGEQFAGRACEACHATTSFRVPDFDHAATTFRLEGAHAEVACGRCHVPEPAPGGSEIVRYRPIAAGCAACHGDAS